MEGGVGQTGEADEVQEKEVQVLERLPQRGNPHAPPALGEALAPVRAEVMAGVQALQVGQGVRLDGSRAVGRAVHDRIVR